MGERGASAEMHEQSARAEATERCSALEEKHS
jgi:hypothetical protein